MLGACPLLLRCIIYWLPYHTDTGHTAESRAWIVSSRSIVPHGSMWGHSHTRAILTIPIRRVIHEDSKPTNCRILDGELHASDATSIRTVRKTVYSFLKAQGSNLHVNTSIGSHIFNCCRRWGIERRGEKGRVRECEVIFMSINEESRIRCYKLHNITQSKLLNVGGRYVMNVRLGSGGNVTVCRGTISFNCKRPVVWSYYYY